MRVLSVAVFACALFVPNVARAEDTPPFLRNKPGYRHLLATALVGDGLRFNNPYRLATPLGSDAESVSRTAAYADFGLAFTLGDGMGLRHGGAMRVSIALEGVAQTVLTPSYLAYRRWHSLAAFGRAGIPIVCNPEVTWGMELAAGGAWFFRGGIGLAAELVGDLFYGAGTREVAVPAYPVLSAQAGLIISYEVLP
jgi:hypothetical protein